MPGQSVPPSDTIHIRQPSRHSTKTLGDHQRYTHYTSKAPHVAVAHQYTAVRYARPLGPDDRFRRAKPLQGIATPLDFRETPFCPQRRDNLQPPDKHLVTEDCLTSDIYLPAAVTDQENERRPVLIWIHGGFLQFGHPTAANCAELARRTGAIIVLPAYRLNLFGFLSCEEMKDPVHGTVGNLGFWDQRLAIEWVAENIHAFGGDKDRITLGGLSAGAYSTFQQTMYESYLPDEQAYIKNVWMMSNGCGLQPKSLEETRINFLALAEACGIPRETDGKLKFETLKKLTADQLVKGLGKIPVNCFRACTDGVFIRRTYMQDIVSGKLGRTLSRRNVKLMIGEVRDENELYAVYAPPKSYFGLVQRLTVEYPAVNSNRLAALYAPKGQLPERYNSWKELFGHVYSDVQVHLSERGLLHALRRDLPAANVFRYRIYRRLKCVDEILPPAWKVTHSSDMAIWFVGNGHRVEPEEKPVVDAWVRPMTDFFARSENFDWGTSGYDQLRTIKEDSWSLGVERDALWDEYIQMWKRLYAAVRRL